MKQKFRVTGMSCSACSAAVERSVKKVDGVKSVNVSLLTNSMLVEYEGDKQQAIIRAVEEAGYGAFPSDEENRRSESKGEDTFSAQQKAAKTRLIVSFAFWIPLMYLAMHHMLYMWFGLPVPPFMTAAFHGTENGVVFALTQFLLLLPILYVNRGYYRTGFRALAKRAPNMDSLIAVGSSAAVAYGIYAIYRIGWAIGHGNFAVAEQSLSNLYFESAGHNFNPDYPRKISGGPVKRKNVGGHHKAGSACPKNRNGGAGRRRDGNPRGTSQSGRYRCGSPRAKNPRRRCGDGGHLFR
jgi:P-type Cu+ transporter